MTNLPSIAVRIRAHINPFGLEQGRSVTDDNGVTALDEKRPALYRVQALPGALRTALNQLCTLHGKRVEFDDTSSPSEWVVGYISPIQPTEYDMLCLITDVEKHLTIAHINSALNPYPHAV